MMKRLILPVAAIIAAMGAARASVVEAHFPSSAAPAVTAANYDATGKQLSLSLGFAPAAGTRLTVVENTGLSFITGRFDNLAQGQTLYLPFGGTQYRFVADYYGGSGNDLVLECGQRRLAAWGGNSNGELADGTTTNRLVPVWSATGGALEGKTILKFSSKATHTLALCTDGTLVAWGRGVEGQLGNGTTTSSSVPVNVDMTGVLAGKSVVALATGNMGSLVLCSDGTLAAWGYNADGQLGNGTAGEPSTVPVLVKTSGALAGRQAVAIARGLYHSLVLCSDGTLVSWGYNSDGQIGDGTTTSRWEPVDITSSGVLAGRQVVKIASGWLHNFAICSDGTVASWGNNRSGQLGISSTTNSFVPVAVPNISDKPGVPVVATVCGVEHTIALLGDGSLASWGMNGSGQLGDGTSFEAHQPVSIRGSGTLAGRTVVALSAGFHHNLALASDGILSSWGYNTYGGLGTGTTFDSNRPTPVDATGPLLGRQVMAMDGGWQHSMALVAYREISSDSTLHSLELSAGVLTPGFDPSVHDYEVTVPGSVSQLLVTPVRSDPNASLSLNGTPVPYGSAAPLVDLAVGENTIILHLTSEDGTTSATYTLNVRRQSADSSLAALSSAALSLTPAFDPEITNYSATADSTLDSILLRARSTHGSATITVNGSPVPSDADHALAIPFGWSTITVRVTSEDGTSVTTYTLDVRRRSYISSLASLSTQPDALAPTFSPEVLTYSAAVEGRTAAITFTATPTDSSASMEINGSPLGTGAPHIISLRPGATQVTVRVTAEDPSFVTDYVVSVHRDPTLRARFNGSGVPIVTAETWTATDFDVDLQLDFAPPTGTALTLIECTGLPFIDGRFANLQHGQRVTLMHGGVAYHFIANYHGGNGNDLVLEWADRRLVSWGGNSLGQLGNGSTTGSVDPVAVATSGVLAGKSVQAIATNGAFNLALCYDGSIAAWGENANGQLGNGTTTQSGVPVLVDATGALSGKTVVALHAGHLSAVALCSDGTLFTWGHNLDGQLGNGSSVSLSSLPVAVDTSGALKDKSVVAVAGGLYHNLALCSDGTLVSWGYNAQGQLGDGTTTHRSTPVDITTSGDLAGKRVTAVAGGYNHSLALCSDGTLVAWGDASLGQLANRRSSDSLTPLVVSKTDALANRTVTAIAAGLNHNLVLCSDGALVSWGENASGQLGNGSTVWTNYPVQVFDTGALYGKTIRSIHCGWSHNLAVGSDGTRFVWGINNQSQLGFEVSYPWTRPAALPMSGQLAGTRPFTADGGNDHTLALAHVPLSSVCTLSALAPGVGTLSPAFQPDITHYTLLLPTRTDSVSFTLTRTDAKSVVTLNGSIHPSGSPGPSQPVAIGSNLFSFIVTAEDGSSKVYTVDATLPNPSHLRSLTPSAGIFDPAFSPSVATHVLRIPSATTTLQLTPVATDGAATLHINGTPVPSGSRSPAISLPAGDSILSIGVNNPETGHSTTYQIAVRRFNLLDAQWSGAASVPFSAESIDAGGTHVQLSLGFAPQPGTRLTVVRCTGLPFINGRFSNLAHGQKVTLVYNGVTYPFIANYFGGDGNDLVLEWAHQRVLAWGGNLRGELGNGTTSNGTTQPVAVVSTGVLAGKSVLQAGTFGTFSYALCSDGTVATWGENASGQLGNGTTTSSSVPVAVARSGALSGKTIVALRGGHNTMLALCSDGSLFSWGNNIEGQLGNGTTGGNSTVPVAVSTSGALAGRSVVSIAAGLYHKLALCSDGTVVSWGYNAQGQLGDNSTTHRNQPVDITAKGALAGRQVIALAAGFQHSLALCADGTLIAWGSNDSKQLGSGATASSTQPIVVAASGALSGRSVTAIAAGLYHNLALCSDGSIAAWGANGNGQSGNNTTGNTIIPVSVAVGLNSWLVGKSIAAISSGWSHCFAEASDGTCMAWGSSNKGQVDYAAYGNVLVPAWLNAGLLNNARIHHLTGGADHSLAIEGLAAPQDPYTLWWASQFTDPGDQANPSVSGPGGTPFADGVPNLLKYAAGLPASSRDGNKITQSGTVIEGDESYLTLTYRRGKSVTGVNFAVEACDTLGGAWTPVNGVLAQVDMGDHWLITVRDTAAIGSRPGRFMRLRVSQ